jgi:hypothetical protein
VPSGKVGKFGNLRVPGDAAVLFMNSTESTLIEEIDSALNRKSGNLSTLKTKIIEEISCQIKSRTLRRAGMQIANRHLRKKNARPSGDKK